MLASLWFASPVGADEPITSASLLRAAEPSCAGDGFPTKPFELSGLLSIENVPFAGAAARLREGDAADGTGFALGAARVAVCGRIEKRYGAFIYNFGFEPYAVAERAQPDAATWGRFTAAEIGFAPWNFLTFYVGVRKLAFSYGHDEPLQELALPIRPYVADSVAPDRRVGATVDTNLGAAHVVVGLYEGSRDLLPTGAGGFLMTARAVAEPMGPVGREVSTLKDAPLWRRRARFAVNASLLYNYQPDTSGYAAGADLAFKWGPLGLVVEYLLATNTLVESPTLAPTPRLSRQGAWAEAAVLVWRPYLELTARYDWLDEPNEPLQRFHAVTTGLTVYAYRTLARLQAAYSHKFHYGLPAEDDVLLLVLTLAK